MTNLLILVIAFSAVFAQAAFYKKEMIKSGHAMAVVCWICAIVAMARVVML